MKSFIINLVFITGFLSSKAQDTIFLNINRDTITIYEEVSRIVVLNYNPETPQEVTELTLDSNCTKIESITYLPFDEKIKNGPKINWYKNGQVHFELNYSNNKMDGINRTFWRDGTLKRDDLFEDGKFISGHVYNNKGEEIEHFDFQVNPTYKRGELAMYRYLNKTVRYPNEEYRKNISGKVIVTFVVEKDGSITNVKVIQGVSEGIDAEAIRVISGMRKWNPGKQDGDLVRVRFALPIKFETNR
ncbi:MAG: TonB family protein [Salibacteraceae bacterium]